MKLKTTIEQLIQMINNNEDVTEIDTSEITDMKNLFDGCKEFNQDISKWDVSKVTDMSKLFWLCEEFNQDILKWDTSSVVDIDIADIKSKQIENNNNPLTIINWDIENQGTIY